jgi:amino acid adenylation domain-containing protein
MTASSQPDLPLSAPLSYPQEGIWYLMQLDPGSTFYNIARMYRCSGKLEMDLLERAFDAVLQHQPALRTTFAIQAGEPRQIVQPFSAVRIPLIDFSGYPAEQRVQRAREYAGEKSNSHFDLESGPLIRVELLRLNPQDHFLFLIAHHTIFDGWSEGLFTTELAHYYSAFLNNTPPALPEIELDQVGYAAWQRSWLQGETAQHQLDYWKIRLAGPLPVMDLPGDRAREQKNGPQGKLVQFVLSGEHYQKIKRVCAENHLTTFRVMVAAYALLLMEETGQEDILIGCPLANRENPELGKRLENTIGMFVNTLPLRFDLSGDPTISELLERVQKTVRADLQNQALPFEKLVEVIKPQRDANRIPLIQVLINMKNISRQTAQDMFSYDFEFEHPRPAFDLSLDIKEIGQILACDLIYDACLFDKLRISRLAARYQDLLLAMLSNLNANVSGLLSKPASPGAVIPDPPGTRASKVGSPALAQNPLSFSQESLWFLNQLDPAIPAYNSVMLYRLQGRLDIQALENSINMIRRRHEVLRAVFPVENGEPRQVIEAFQPLALPFLALPGLHFSEREAKIVELAKKECQIPFDLRNGPLQRAALLQFAPDEHILLLVSHHIVSDGWSEQLVLDELSQCYRAFALGSQPALPELAAQYSDYARWQHEQLRKGGFAAQFDYWTALIDRDTPALDLPLDHLRPAVQTYRAERYVASLPQQTSAALKAFCQEERATFYMGLLAALDVLLYRYTGQSKITVGSPLANRTRPEFEALIGFFVNTLPVQVEIEADLTFREMLALVRERMLAAITHQSLPFDLLVKKINPERDLSRLPLFQVVLNYVNVPQFSPNLDELKIERITGFDTGVTAFDLEFNIVEKAGALQLFCMYNSGLFERETITRLMRTWHNIIENALAEPDLPVAQLNLLSDSERSKILYDWNRTESSYPDLCLHQLVEAQVERTPDATAVIFDGNSLTYRQLNQRANRLAHLLRSAGVGANSLVAVFLERSVELPAVLLAIHKAGGATLPLDPAYPQERLAFMLEDARPQVIVTQNKLTAHLPKTGILTHCIDGERIDGDQPESAGQNLAPLSSPGDLAFVRYTSGSTGKPKGVRILQRSVVNTLTYLSQQPGIKPNDRLLAITTISFDISDVEMFLALIAGAQVIVVSSETAADGNLLLDKVKQYQPTLMQATPTTWRMLLLAGWQGSADLKIITGGEALSPDLKADLLKRCDQLWNLYGPTETAIYSIGGRMLPEDQRITIGKPIFNTHVYILDGHMQPVPVGITGSIYIGGDGVSPGYLERPELDAERFMANPFVPDDRLYATGDLGRYLPDGQVEYLGRSDQQVKVRGYRIELGEIETVLKQHPGVRDVVMAAVADAFGSQDIVCYFIPAGADLPLSSLRMFLAGRLPAFMIPARFIQVDSFPLLPNGKVDRKTLASLRAAALTSSTKALPANEIESELLSLWRELLGEREIGVSDNFFDLGGHSLMAVRLFSRIEKKFHQRIPLSALFQHGSIQHLASLIQTNEGVYSAQAIVPIQPPGSQKPLYLLPGQGGSVLYFRELAVLLGADQPVYGLQSMLPGGGWQVESVEAVAADFVRELRAFQPEGPYRIAGHSFGGFVALEMGRQLVAAGQELALLVLFDSMPLASFRKPKPAHLQALHLFDRVRYHFNNLARRKGRERQEYLAELTHNLMLRNFGRPIGGLADNEFFAKVSPSDQVPMALARYKPARYPFGFTVFQVTEHAWIKRWDPILDWQDHMDGKLTVYTVPGDHVTMLDSPHDGEVARLLRICLEQGK